jgi:hypothetical protein
MQPRSVHRTGLTGLLSLLAAVAFLTGGCVQTAMLPADRLEDGETRGSLGLEAPGALFYPRINAQVTHGVGGADLTANVSAVPLSDQTILGGGVAARSYLTRDLGVEVQAQGTALSGQPAGLVLMGLQTIPPDEGGWYAGGQTGVVSGPSPDVLVWGGSSAETARTWTAPVVGGTVGYGPIGLGPSARMQIELKANMPVWGDEGEAPPATTGLSVGVFGLFV